MQTVIHVELQDVFTVITQRGVPDGLDDNDMETIQHYIERGCYFGKKIKGKKSAGQKSNTIPVSALYDNKEEFPSSGGRTSYTDKSKSSKLQNMLQKKRK
eukprot:11952186-Ditylum_brightwellii.AAC.1